MSVFLICLLSSPNFRKTKCPALVAAYTPVAPKKKGCRGAAPVEDDSAVNFGGLVDDNEDDKEESKAVRTSAQAKNGKSQFKVSVLRPL